jgi:diacylglycerol kinase family enzyme
VNDSGPTRAPVASPAVRAAAVPVLLNAHARAVRCEGPDAVLARVRAACEAAGLAAQVDLVEAEEAEGRLRAAIEGGATAVVVGGGDGTVRTAAQVLAGSDVALGILPLGTLNHCARDLGLPADLVEAARVIAAGAVRAVDVGDLDGEVFVNNSSLGLYPEMVRVREEHERRFKVSRLWSVVRASWRTFWRFPMLELEILRPSGIGRLTSPVVFVGNGEYVLGSRVGTRRSLEDGVLFLCMLTSGRWRTLWLAVRSLFTAVPKEKHMRCLFVEEVAIALSRGHAWVSLDGEVRKARGNLRYRVRTKALRVLAPPRPEAPAS